MHYKLQKAFCTRIAGLMFFSLCMAQPVISQDRSYTRPPVTTRFKDYRKQVSGNALKKMVELKSLIPLVVYDLRYAGPDNFMHRPMYRAGTRHTFLRLPAAGALKKVQEELAGLGLGLKIFDAYRPYSVTVQFWELVKDERFVAHPKNGSGHNRGAAVDLTLINLKTGRELDMGTGFDNFTDTAHQGFTALPEEVMQNRLLLKTTMEKYGFRPYNDEWWHYSWPEAAQFELLDIPFRKLAKRSIR